jgi:hypothetical protein
MTDPLSEFCCWICYAPEGMSMRFDRKGRPYVVCCCCGVRCFCKSIKHVRGIYVTTSLVQAMMAQLRKDPAQAARREDEANTYAESIRTRIAAVAPAPLKASYPSSLEDLANAESVQAARR